MRPSHPIRGRSGINTSSLHARKPAAVLEGPPALQRSTLKALELPKAYRGVLLLKEIHEYGLAEIAAILGISIDTALARWKPARREIGHLGDSDAMERAE